MISNKDYQNQSNLLIDALTSNTQATFNNSTFSGVLTLPSGQIVTASKELVDLNSVQTLTNKTIAQISNVDNTSDLNKPISTATQTALDLKANLTSISNINNTSDLNKPISTATQTALDLKANLTSISNINNTSDLDKPVSTATQTALDLKANLTSISNINNTSDLNKPISTATQTALNLKQDINLPISFYTPSSTQLGYIIYGTTTSTNNIVLTTSTTTYPLYTLTLPAYGVWMIYGQIEYFCYSNTSLTYSQILSTITPSSVFTNNNLYSQILPSGTLPIANSIIQQIQGIFNINATPTGSNNVININSNVTFSLGNVLVKCKDSVTTGTTTVAITNASIVVLTSTNAAIVVGMKISGAGITGSPIVVGKNGANISMSSPQTLGASTVLTFTNTANNTYLYAVRVG